MASTYWFPRKISSSSLSRLQMTDQACVAAARAIDVIVTMIIRMISSAAPSSRLGLRAPRSIRSSGVRLDVTGQSYGGARNASGRSMELSGAGVAALTLGGAIAGIDDELGRHITHGVRDALSRPE